MNIYFTCFSDKKYIKARKQLCERANKIFDGVFEYDYDKFLIKTDFYQKNIKMLMQENSLQKGCGWKPYIILDALNRVGQDDVVYYMDCGDVFEDDIVGFLKRHFLENDILLLDGTQLNKCWTKFDCFHIMNCNEIQYKNVIQLEAGVCGFKKNNIAIKFLKGWLYYCQDENVIRHIPNKYGQNDSCFVEHRGDQSILTNLKVKYDLLSFSNDHEIRSLVTCNVNIA